MPWGAGRARRWANAGLILSIAQAAWGAVVVPFWLQPGEEEVERIPAQLRRFL